MVSSSTRSSGSASSTTSISTRRFEHTFSLLRPGGRFAFSEPNLANPQVWAERNVEVVRRRDT